MYDNSTKKSLRQKVQRHPDGSKEYRRDVPGYRGWYRISDLGRVKSISRIIYRANQWKTYPYRTKTLILKFKKNNDYCIVTLFFPPEYNKRPLMKYVHRLVLEAFVGPCPNGMEARHLNSSPSDNRLENLRWGTPKENAKDKLERGSYPLGEKHGNSKATEQEVRIVRLLADTEMYTSREIAEIIGGHLSSRTIREIINRKVWAWM